MPGANERDLQTEDLYRLNTRTGRKSSADRAEPGQGRRVVPRRKQCAARGRCPAKARRSAKSSGIATARTLRGERSPPRRSKRRASDASGGVRYRRLAPRLFESGERPGSSFASSTPRPERPEAVVLEHRRLGRQHSFANCGDHHPSERPASRSSVSRFLRRQAGKRSWFDERYAKLQALMDASLPQGNVNQFTVLQNGTVVVFSWSDRDPGRIFPL